jgi:tight adherence protein C
MALNLFASISGFVALACAGLWLVLGAQQRPADQRMRALALSRSREGSLGNLPFQVRVVAPMIESIGKLMASLLPNAFLRRAERRLILAGAPMKPLTFYALMLSVGGLMAGSYIAVLVVASPSPAPLAFFVAPVLGAAGAYVVVFWLSSQARSRQMAMLRGLPDSMDLLTVCVEAGLGLDAAFHRVAEKQRGPLVDEMRQMLREIGLGKARRDALLDLADHTQLEDVRAFANAVIQAEQLGTSLAQVLRVQSQRLRVRRRQRAEQEAHRAPVKMVFPLAFCLMPSLFIFILGPMVVKVANLLSNS